MASHSTTMAGARGKAACVAKQLTKTDQESRSASHGAATSVTVMASIESVTLEMADPTAVNRCRGHRIAPAYD